MKSRFALFLALAAFWPLPTMAQALPDVAPLPFARPGAVTAPETALERALQPTAILRPDVESAMPALSREAMILTGGLDALSAGDADLARKARNALSSERIERSILDWAIALSGNVSVSSAEIGKVMQELDGWPGVAALSAARERALFREKADANTILKAFEKSAPQTYEGTVALARAFVAKGDVRRAGALLGPFWRTRKLDATAEIAFLREFSPYLSKEDHRFRMERMLYEDRIRSAERVATLASAEALSTAWAAVIRGNKNALKLLDAVPKEQQSAGYLFARIRFLRRQEHFKEAAALMLKAPREAAALVDPDEWWIERRALSRELLDLDDPDMAYRIAAAHSAESPARAADAEFHAGWYALRALDNAKGAADHFAKVAAIAEGPISNARAYYWMGRAAEANGDDKAKAYFERAAVFGTTFYGQLATAKLGRNVLQADTPTPSLRDRQTFRMRPVVKAIRRLQDTNHGWRAATLYRALAEELSSPGELALLAAMAERRGDHTMALRVGKIAAGRGIDIGVLSHPLGAIPGDVALASDSKALAYAVARQETEFNGSAVSSAGARGLLQLMPGTAREMARKSGIPYSRDRLTQDIAYNTTLGSAYLDEQLGRFNGSYVLTFAGYNAGPRRASEWMVRYGDPRGQSVEAIVDWIERIPFAETRNYVQRVMENFQVYKMRLSGHFDIAGDLAAGG
ncbi:lytic transglycosylase domain-containing protein [Nitratireductor indicus]|nr:lytic transglycosylase domain-containing protein [Nitratireductor indicus]MDS1134675.1 lytic transglycosylase domain-containing protein [Nitratireductor indicus]